MLFCLLVFPIFFYILVHSLIDSHNFHLHLIFESPFVIALCAKAFIESIYEVLIDTSAIELNLYSCPCLFVLVWYLFCSCRYSIEDDENNLDLNSIRSQIRFLHAHYQLLEFPPPELKEKKRRFFHKKVTETFFFIALLLLRGRCVNVSFLYPFSLMKKGERM